MELRQVRYFVLVIGQGGIYRVARELGVVTSALSQQISRLENELSTRLLQRTSSGVKPTGVELAFLHQAQNSHCVMLMTRHAPHSKPGCRANVSVGMAPSTTSAYAVCLSCVRGENVIPMYGCIW